MEFPRDVKRRHLSGGMWKTAQIAKAGKHRHESTKPGRRYVVVPPITGWPGGLPEHNGWKPRASK